MIGLDPCLDFVAFSSSSIFFVKVEEKSIDISYRLEKIVSKNVIVNMLVNLHCVSLNSHD